jgi:hypothetical protein
MTSTRRWQPAAKPARARYKAERSPPLSTTTYTGNLLTGHEDELRYYAPNAESARAVGAVARVIAACRSAYSMWAQRGGRAKGSG